MRLEHLLSGAYPYKGISCSIFKVRYNSTAFRRRFEPSAVLGQVERFATFIDIIKGNEISVPTYNRGSVRLKKVIKSVWGMPRLLEAKKDVVSCEKLRGFANEI